MTKQIRIENGDTSDHCVIVEIWQKLPDDTDELVSSIELPHPTTMTEETIWPGRWLVVKEKEHDQP